MTLRLKALRSLRWNRKDARERRWDRERVEHGISESDAWDLFAHLDLVIARGVRQLADELHGCPSRMSDEFGGDVHRACEHWKSILEEIALGFEKDYEAQANVEPEPPGLARSFQLLAEHWRDLWD